MIADGLLPFLVGHLDDFLLLDTGQLKNDQLGLLARAFYVITDLCKNSRVAPQLTSSHLVARFLSIHEKFKDSEFLNELFISSLSHILSSYEGVLLLQDCRIDLQSLVLSSINSQNKKLLENSESIVLKLMKNEDLKTTIAKVKGGETSFENLAYLSFLSKNEMMTDLLEDAGLMDLAMSIFTTQSLKPEQQFGLIKFFSCILGSSEKMSAHFNSCNGVQLILEKINDSDNFVVWAEYVNLLSSILKNMSREEVEALLPDAPFQRIVRFFEQMNVILDTFLKNAMTPEKAHDSLEFNKNEVARAILLEMKSVKPDELVSSQLALDYISAEHFVVSIFRLLQRVGEFKLPQKFQISEEFVNTCTVLMKVFKNSKTLHEKMFGMLSAFKLEARIGAAVMKANWPFLLSDVVWKKPNWKFFAYFVMKFFDGVVKNKDNDRLVKGNANVIKLIASIKNFIIEEDYKDFDDPDADSKEAEAKDVLTFAQEREVYKKGTELVGLLTDSSTLQTFKTNVDKSIKSFKPKQETIQILRAEYAVLTCLNGDNFFGNEGLKSGMHKVLAQNIVDIEKSVLGKPFVDKEKLMADCIRSIANFVCITWNESGKNAYERAAVSAIVFELFEQYLKSSVSPLASYIMLKAFREWLINRIEIIENVSNMERDKIYDPESFMMVAAAIKEAVITAVMDSLYLTHQRFHNSEKVVSLNFEVIILLGYVYPQWKSKVAKNFIPQALEALGQDNLSMNSDIKAIELLKQLTGTDEKAEQICTEALEAAVNNGALQKLCKSIADNNFDKKYIICAKPLMEAFGEYEVKMNTQDTQNRVLADLQKIAQFNKLPTEERGNPKLLADIAKTLDELNSYGLIEHLQKFMLANQHPELLGDLWNFVNATLRNNNGNANDALLAKIDKGCALGVLSHMGESAQKSEVLKQLFGNPKTFKFQNESSNLLINAFQSLQRHSQDPAVVQLNAGILNECFPSAYSLVCQKIAQELKFQPTLEFIFNSYGSAENRDLAQETNNLYFNLTQKQDNAIVEKMIRKIMRKFKQDAASGNVTEIESSFLSLMPFLQHTVFLEHQDEFSTDDYILKTLLLLHAKLKEKLDKTTFNLLNEAIGDSNTPDIGHGNKKIMADEIALAKTLTEYILSLPETLQKKVAVRAEVVKLTDLELVLTGNQRSFDLIEMYCANPEARAVLTANKTFEIASFLLLKHTKDSFKPQEYPLNDNGANSLFLSNLSSSNLTKSMLTGRSKVNTPNSISFLASEENQQGKLLDDAKSEAIEKLLARYASLAQPVLNKLKTINLIEVYIQEMGSFKASDQKQLTNCLAISRLMACLLSIKNNPVDFLPYSENLQKALGQFLDAASSEPVMNKKLMRFFENSLCKIAKRLEDSPKNFRNPELWNKLIDRYFVLAPDALKINHRKILKALDLTKPKGKQASLRKKLFEEKSGQLRFVSEFADANLLSAKNTLNINLILTNLRKTIETVNVDHALTLKTMEGLSRSKEFCTALISHATFEVILTLIANYNDLGNEDKFNFLTEVLLNSLSLAAKDNDLKGKLNLKIHPDNLMRVFLENIESLRRPLMSQSLEALALLFSAVDNTSAFFDKRMPEKILDIIGPGEDWCGENASSLLLLAIMMRDFSLEKIAASADVLDHVIQNMGSDVLRNPSAVSNPKELFNKQLSELSRLPETQKAELVAYLLGELSKYEHNAFQLAQKDGKSLIFSLYDAYERHDNEPVIATKLIEAARNAVYALEEETIEQNPKEIEKMLARIPAQIQKYRALVLVPKYLQDILDFFKKREKPQTENLPFKKMNKVNAVVRQSFALEDSLIVRESVLPKISISQKVQLASQDSLQRKVSEVQATLVPFAEVFKSNDISEIYRYIVDQLEKGPLTLDDTKMFEVANQKLQEILKAANDPKVYAFLNLQVPNCLRLIANSDNSTNFQKLDALKLLNQFLETADVLPKFVDSVFYLQKSAELINQFATLCPDIDQLKRSERDPLLEDLKFMKTLTDEADGAEFALEVDANTPIIKTMVGILKSDCNDGEIKVKAIEILNNLLKVGKEPEIEQELLRDLAEMFNKNNDTLPILTALSELTATILRDSPANKQFFTDKRLLDLPKKAIEHFPHKNKLNNAISAIVLQLSKDFPASHEQILDSPIAPYLAKTFNNPNSDKVLHQNVAKSLIEIGYGSPEKKQRLLKNGFTAGLITLLNMYSSPQYYDEDLCSTVLKLIANFSTIPEGVELLLKDNALPAFHRFFDKYKETLPQHNKIMMATIANMSYEQRPAVTSKIINDKGLELIIAALEFYTGKRDLDTTEVAIDALSHLAVNPEAVKYLEKTNVVDALIDLVRSQLSEQLAYTSLGCLTSFAAHEVFANKIFQKGGQDAAADVYKVYHADPKNLMQATKFLTVLTNRFPHKTLDFLKSGVPAKIIAQFDEKWP